MRRALVAGLIWGVFCGVANGIPVATTLAQMAVPWIWVAALVAYRLASSIRQGALLGAVTLLAANITYLGIGFISRELSAQTETAGLGFFLLWATVGLIIGPIAGVLGRWLSTEPDSFRAVVMLGTVTIAEPLALWAHIDHIDAHLTFVLVATAGVAFPLVWFSKDRRKALSSLGLVVVLTYPVAVALEATLIALGQVSAPMRLI